MIYAGGVYGALKKKKDRGADIKTGLFMEQSNTRAVVWMCTIRSVCQGQTGCVCVDGGGGGGGLKMKICDACLSVCGELLDLMVWLQFKNDFTTRSFTGYIPEITRPKTQESSKSASI